MKELSCLEGIVHSRQLERTGPSIMSLAKNAVALRFGLALCAGLASSAVSTAALADARCQQLVALDRQYAGVALTSAQQSLKRKLVAWYNVNCGQTRRTASRQSSEQ
jgi:hypothetical protein